MMPESSRAEREDAQTFLDLLAGEPNALHCFQTYADNPASLTPEGRRALARTIWGRFADVEPELRRLNAAGASICVAVNRMRDNSARRTDNVLNPRACWHENDGGLRDGLAHVWPSNARPSMIVQTRPGHHHFYWLTPQTSEADWPAWTGVGRHMIAHRGSDPKCLRREQVLRVPSFTHQKDPLNKHTVTLLQSGGATFSLSELVAAFPAPTEEQFLAAGAPVPQGTNTSSGDARDLELSMIDDDKFARVVDALWRVDPDESREKWLRCLMALESTRHPERRNAGEAWSRGRAEAPNAKYVEGEPAAFMRSFREGAARLVSVGTIMQYAREAALKQGGDFSDMLPGTPVETAAADGWTVSLASEMPTVQPMHEWVIPNLLVAEGMHTAISGEPGVGKSSAVFGVMAALATSTPWLGSKSPILRPHEGRPLASVYLDLAEGTPAQIGYSLNCALSAATVRAGGNLRDRSAGKYCAVLGTTRSAFPLVRTDYGVLVPDKANLAVLRTQLMRAHERLAGVAPVRAVIVDNLARFLVAASENEPGPVLQVFDLLAALLSDVFPDAGIVWVAHPPKSNETAVRGSGAIFGALRGVVRMVNCHSLSRGTGGSRLREGMTLGQRVLQDAGITPSDAALAAHRLIYHDKSNFSMRMIDPIIVRREAGALLAIDGVEVIEDDAKQHENLEALGGWLNNPVNSVEEYPERKLIGLMTGTRGMKQLIPMPHRLLGDAYEAMLAAGVELGYLSVRLKAHGTVVSKLYSAGPRYTLL